MEGGEGEGEADGEKVILTPPDDSGSERDGMEVDTAETNNSKVEEVDHPRNVSQESGDMPGIGGLFHTYD